MKSNKEVITLYPEEDLTNKEILKWYKKGYDQGMTWGKERPSKTNNSAHANGLQDGWNDHHPKERLILLLKQEKQC